MPDPLTATAAAAATTALLAYASARMSLPNDVLVLRGVLRASVAVSRRERTQRLNPFYDLEAWAARPSHAHKPLLLYCGRQWTFAQLYDAALRCGRWLVTEHAVQPRQVVALCYPTSDMFVVLWMALWSIGAVPAFINHQLPASTGLTHSLRVSSARICLVDPQVASQVRAAAADLVPSVELVVLDDDLQTSIFAMPPVRAPDHVRNVAAKSDMAILIYTSGTTGLPKAAIVSWQKVCMPPLVINTVTGRRPDDIMFSVWAMPLYHSAAAIVGFMSTLGAGSTLALAPKFSRETFWREVRETKATIILYIGEVIRNLLANPPELDPVTGANQDRAHKVRVLLGAGLRADVWHDFVERFAIDTVCEFYGATEGPAICWNVSRNRLSEGSVGRVGTLLRALIYNRSSAIIAVDWAGSGDAIRDAATGLCVPVRAGETGEMLFRVAASARDDIPAAFQGYLDNAEANAAKIIRDVRVRGDAWFRTGDALRWEDNSDGLLFFSDRLGDSFRWKGENVSATEVGNVMGRYPAVVEANVYGVELPRHDGRAGCASVVFRRRRSDPDDCSSSSDSNSSSSSDSQMKLPTAETLRGLVAHLRAELPRYAVPLFLRIAREPGEAEFTTGTHKQQKVVLRDAGVDPARTDPAKAPIYWLQGDTYVPFEPADWSKMQHGGVKL